MMTPENRNMVEPSAGMRQLAHQMREIYVALVGSGFTEEEARTMVVAMVTSFVGGKKDD